MPVMLSIPSGWEILIILVIVILLFGAKKLPALGKGLGKGIKEFKDAKDGKNNEIEDRKED